MRDRTARVASTVGPAVAAVVAGIIGTIALTVAAGFVAVAPAAAEGEVAIEVMANGQPADSAPGPTVESGATVNLRYVITVGSTEPLFDFVVSNLTGDAKPNCDVDGDGKPDGVDGNPGPLSAGDSFLCVASVVAGDPGITFASAGRVTAYNSEVTETFTSEDAAHYTTVRPTSTQAPTTQAPTTAAPTTAAPTTAAPTSTAVPTTEAPTTSSSSTSSTLDTSTGSTSAISSTSSSIGTASTTSAAAIDADAAAPDELAAVDDDAGGFPLWWVVLAFAAGGGIAVGVSSRLTDRSDKNAAVPDH